MKEPEDDFEFGVGSLISFKGLTNEQINLFIKLISSDYSYLFQILFNVVDDENLVLKLVDIFAGQKIQFPQRKKLYKLLEKIKIYTFVKSKGYSEESYKLLAKQYGKRISQIKAIVDRIDYLLDSGRYNKIDEHNNIKDILEGGKQE